MVLASPCSTPVPYNVDAETNRLKHPSERRTGLPRETAWLFWPRFAWETFYKHAVMIKVVGWLLWCKLAIICDANARTYTDRALTPVDDDDKTLDLLTKTTGVDAALLHQRKVQRLTQALRAQGQRQG